MTEQATESDEDRRGPWCKASERYEDGCREDRIVAERVVQRAGVCRCEPYAYIGTRQAGEPERCERCWGLVDDEAVARLDAAYAESMEHLTPPDKIT